MISFESMKKFGKIQKSTPKWKRNSHTTRRSIMKPIKKIKRQKEQYHMPIFNHIGQRLNNMKAMAMMNPMKRKRASLPRGLGMFHEQKPFSLKREKSPDLAGTMNLGYFFFASDSYLGSLSKGINSLQSMNTQPSFIESSILSRDQIALTSLNCLSISVLLCNTISWKLSPNEMS